MTTKTKINIAGVMACIMSFLNVFSKPLHIPEPVQWFLILGIFLPIGLLFRFLRQAKQEREANHLPESPKQKIKRNLLISFILVVVAGLCSPFWMPLTGTNLGFRGNLFSGLITIAITGIIMGVRARQLGKNAEPDAPANPHRRSDSGSGAFSLALIMKYFFWGGMGAVIGLVAAIFTLIAFHAGDPYYHHSQTARDVFWYGIVPQILFGSLVVFTAIGLLVAFLRSWYSSRKHKV